MIKVIKSFLLYFYSEHLEVNDSKCNKEITYNVRRKLMSSLPRKKYKKRLEIFSTNTNRKKKKQFSIHSIQSQIDQASKSEAIVFFHLEE